MSGFMGPDEVNIEDALADEFETDLALPRASTEERPDRESQ